MLHQVAVRAYELGRLRRDHLGSERLQALLSGQREDRIVLLFRLLGPGLLLDEDVLDGLYVLVAATGCRGGGRRRGLLVVGGLRGVLFDLFVFERVFEVFHRAIPLLGPGDCTAEHPTDKCSGPTTPNRGESFPDGRDSTGFRGRKKRTDRRGPKRPLGPRRRGAAFSTQPLGSSVRPPPKRRTQRG